jgi:hypothetical protein
MEGEREKRERDGEFSCFDGSKALAASPFGKLTLERE